MKIVKRKKKMPCDRYSAAFWRKSAATMLAALVLACERVARLYKCATLRDVYSKAGTSFADASNCDASHAFTSAIRAASRDSVGGGSIRLTLSLIVLRPQILR